MKSLFIHNILFRLLCPFLSGALVYILILLINNNVEQIQETFLGQELYVCIGLSFIIQEYARFSLIVFDKFKNHTSILWQVILQLVCSLIMSITIVSLAMILYFKNFLGYTPNFRELVIFNSIFCFIAIIYMMLYFAHQFLYKTNTQKIEEELEALNDVEMNFKAFKSEINIDLLFESLESLIVLMKQSPESAETFIDHFSSVYRHTLTNSNKELILVSKELEIVMELAILFRHLPYRKIALRSELDVDFFLVPGSMIFIIEKIIRSSISSAHLLLELNINADLEYLLISYVPEDNLNGGLSMSDLKELSDQYQYYSSKVIEIKNIDRLRTIYLPKLMINESLHS